MYVTEEDWTEIKILHVEWQLALCIVQRKPCAAVCFMREPIEQFRMTIVWNKVGPGLLLVFSTEYLLGLSTSFANLDVNFGLFSLFVIFKFFTGWFFVFRTKGLFFVKTCPMLETLRKKANKTFLRSRCHIGQFKHQTLFAKQTQTQCNLIMNTNPMCRICHTH